MRVAIATCEVVPDQFDDDELIVEALARRGVEAGFVSWDAEGVDWAAFELVVVRSTWDYTPRLEEFVGWADGDRRAVAESARGDRVERGQEVHGGAGGGGIGGGADGVRRAGGSGAGAGRGGGGEADGVGGRAGDGAVRAGRSWRCAGVVGRLGAAGRTAMVQPYLGAVDSVGETALVHVGGEFTHALRKRAVLQPNEVAPLRDDPLGAAEAMYDPELVRASESTAAEREVAGDVLAWVAERFGEPPLYARVDLVPGPDGEPVLMELEVVEPCLYLHESPATAERLAEAIVAEF